MKKIVYKAMAAGLAVPLMLASARTEASPSTLYSGSIQGQWANPVLSGSLIDGATGVVTSYDNTKTAACNLSPCPRAPATFPGGGGGATVAWGDGATAARTSVVSFSGATFTNVAPDTVFDLGTLTYTNGTSDLDSLIFGASLTLTALLTSPSGTTVDSFLVQLGLTTTNNTGTTAQNADFIDFRNSLGTIAPVTFNVFEGATATAILSGKIVGDPMLFATQIAIAQGSQGSGFIGAGVPQLVIPEPSTWWLCIAGLALLKPFRIRAGRANGVSASHA